MQPANDNEVLPNEMPTRQVDAGTIDVPQNSANPSQQDDATKFLDEYINELYPLFLQGNLTHLNQDIKRLVDRYKLTQEQVHAISEKLNAIIESSESAEQSQRECIAELTPTFSNNSVLAEKWFAYHVLQGLTGERISILASGQIDGFESYEKGEAGIKQKQDDLNGNARSLSHMMTEFGVGSTQAGQIIRRFDAATQAAISEFKGVSYGGYPSV